MFAGSTGCSTFTPFALHVVAGLYHADIVVAVLALLQVLGGPAGRHLHKWATLAGLAGWVASASPRLGRLRPWESLTCTLHLEQSANVAPVEGCSESKSSS